MNEDEKREARKIWNRTYYLKHRAERKNEEPQREGENLEPQSEGHQDHTNRLLAMKQEYEEHRGYREAFDPTRPHHINEIPDSVLNPRGMIKHASDSPQGYGETGVLCCSICGNTNLRKDGSCPLCSPDQQSNEVAFQQALSQSEQSMSQEQFNAQNQPKPPKQGDPQNFEDWSKTH
jgi:hypothetical protein